VTYDYNLRATQGNLAKFARSLCENFPALQNEGHPKWKEVSLATPTLGQGWSYYPPMQRELGRCIASQMRQSPATPTASNCTTEQKVLGLCR
jgi:uncharacterized protein